MRIGYFGGSFDPPHRAHRAVACAARDAFSLYRVLLAPTGRQPFKTAGPVASFEDRLAMVRLLCHGEQALEASAIDAPRAGGEANYTVDTLERLRAGLPASSHLFAIVGADAFLGVPQWRKPQRLFALAEWIVVSRPGVGAAALDALQLTPAQRERVHWLNSVHDPASATSLRHELQGTATADRGALTPSVAEYIRLHCLYGRRVL